MKTNQPIFFIAFFTLLAAISCSKDVQRTTGSPAATNMTNQVTNNVSSGRAATPSGTCNPNAYIITLVSHTLVNGQWEWVWSVQNSSPGNGNNGTVQNLSHWGMEFGPCVNVASITGAAYSPDGVNWISFTPVYQADPSQACFTTPVLKFDYGTTGSAKSYYKLVFKANYAVVPAPGYYKSGANTGCCTFTFSGVGCTDGENPDIR